MDEACSSAGTVAREGSFQEGKRTRVEVGWSTEVEGGKFFRKLCIVGSEERM